MRIIPSPNTAKQAGSRTPKKTLQERMARLAAIEKAKCKYIPIECGHYTTLDAFDLYLVCRPHKGMAYCETCHKWLPIAKPPIPVMLPQEPLF